MNASQVYHMVNFGKCAHLYNPNLHQHMGHVHQRRESTIVLITENLYCSSTRFDVVMEIFTDTMPLVITKLNFNIHPTSMENMRTKYQD